MDISALKDKLGDETFAKLSGYVDELKSKVDEARSESITGRKGLKSKLEAAEAAQAKLMEKLGVDSLDDIDNLPDAKGAAEAARQYESKLKRMERDLGDSNKARDEAVSKFKGGLQKVAIAEALAGHEFVARDLVESYVGQRLTWEGDDLYFKADDGKLVSVKDGVAGVAKSRPELLKAAGTGGAGIRQPNAGSGAGGKTMARAEFEQLAPQQRVEMAKQGVVLT
jgi:hypothetical protein